jgi:hypothetical protein
MTTESTSKDDAQQLYVSTQLFKKLVGLMKAAKPATSL